MNRKNLSTRKVYAGDVEITYTLERKSVKNINLRVKQDGSVRVSAGPRVNTSQIDDFVKSKGQFIVRAQKRFETAARADEENYELIKDADPGIFNEILDRLYPLIEPYGIKKPAVRIRTMKSRWGSCLVNKGIITLNRKLLAKPVECIEYVVMHELCHFIHPNHSKQFYEFMGRLMPDWKERKGRLNGRF